MTDEEIASLCQTPKEVQDKKFVDAVAALKKEFLDISFDRSSFYGFESCHHKHRSPYYPFHDVMHSAARIALGISKKDMNNYITNMENVEKKADEEGEYLTVFDLDTKTYEKCKLANVLTDEQKLHLIEHAISMCYVSRFRHRRLLKDLEEMKTKLSKDTLPNAD